MWTGMLLSANVIFWVYHVYSMYMLAYCSMNKVVHAGARVSMHTCITGSISNQESAQVVIRCYSESVFLSYSYKWIKAIYPHKWRSVTIPWAIHQLWRTWASWDVKELSFTVVIARQMCRELLTIATKGDFTISSTTLGIFLRRLKLLTRKLTQLLCSTVPTLLKALSVSNFGQINQC